MSDSISSVILFAKTPESDSAKTRIAKTHGKKEAARIYRELLQVTSYILHDISHHVAFTGSHEPGSLKELFPRARSFFSQEGTDLGSRLLHACNHLFAQGITNLCAIGADCPYLTPHDISTSFSQLKTGVDVVIGPTTDGGYYLIGCTQKGLPIFSATQWSTAHLFEETMTIIKHYKLTHHLLEKRDDIDYMKDYIAWKNIQ